jgi:copper(I)-binding protein
MKSTVALVALLAASAVSNAWAGVTVTDPWVRGVVAGQTSTGAYMHLASTAATTLVAVSTPVAKVAQVHEMTMHGDMMMMQPVAALPVPANGAVDLDPNGYHIMITGLKRPLVDGEKIPLTLTFKDAAGVQTTVTVQAVVHPLAQSKAGEHDHMQM